MILLFSLILLPLFSFICSILFSNLVNKKILGYFSSILIIIAFFNSSFFNFLIYNTNERFLFQLGNCIKLSKMNIFLFILFFLKFFFSSCCYCDDNNNGSSPTSYFLVIILFLNVAAFSYVLLFPLKNKIQLKNVKTSLNNDSQELLSEKVISEIEVEKTSIHDTCNVFEKFSEFLNSEFTEEIIYYFCPIIIGIILAFYFDFGQGPKPFFPKNFSPNSTIKSDISLTKIVSKNEFVFPNFNYVESSFLKKKNLLFKKAAPATIIIPENTVLPSIITNTHEYELKTKIMNKAIYIKTYESEITFVHFMYLVHKKDEALFYIILTQNNITVNQMTNLFEKYSNVKK